MLSDSPLIIIEYVEISRIIDELSAPRRSRIYKSTKIPLSQSSTTHALPHMHQHQQKPKKTKLRSSLKCTRCLNASTSMRRLCSRSRQSRWSPRKLSIMNFNLFLAAFVLDFVILFGLVGDGFRLFFIFSLLLILFGKLNLINFNFSLPFATFRHWLLFRFTSRCRA